MAIEPTTSAPKRTEPPVQKKKEEPVAEVKAQAPEQEVSGDEAQVKGKSLAKA